MGLLHYNERKWLVTRSPNCPFIVFFLTDIQIINLLSLENLTSLLDIYQSEIKIVLLRTSIKISFHFLSFLYLHFVGGCRPPRDKINILQRSHFNMSKFDLHQVFTMYSRDWKVCFRLLWKFFRAKRNYFICLRYLSRCSWHRQGRKHGLLRL